MPVPQWQPGTTYAPGALVVPRSSAPPTFVDLTNPSLTDTTGWDLGAPMAILADGQGYAGKGRIYLPSTTSGAVALNQSHIPVNAGQVITTSAMMKHATAADSHSSDGLMRIHWYKADNTEIQPPTAGNGMPSLSSSDWQKVEASGPAPAGVAYCRIGVGMYRNSTDTIQASSFGVFYTPQTAARATMYKATQPKPGKSANAEPTWPPLGQSVTDNQVIWEGVNIDRLVWQASPLLTSGATEPTWPNAPGTVVHDGTIDWVGTVPYITDPNCPNTPVVAIMASKVFAADKDIVRFCATANALDWSSPQDAGYLPTGLQQSNSNDMAVLAPYRGNLTAFNASAFQNWQVDPNPAAMALLDQMEGIGSIWRLAAQPVGNELFYLSALGVRSVSVAAGGDNLQNGDIGMPVDSLVQAAATALAAGISPRAMYYPGAGQYWLAFPGATTTTFVFTMNAGKGKWGRYVFPFSVDAFAQLGNDCFIRHGDVVSRIDESAATDEVAGVPVNFPGTVQWGWLDFGSPGRTKMLAAFDIVGSGNPSVSVGYDQTNLAAFTDPYAIGPDTVPGMPIPLPVAAPSLSVKLTYPGGEAWSIQSVQLYLDDTAGQP